MSDWPGRHVCAAHGCDREIPIAQLMCKPHYRLIPSRLKKKLAEAFDRWKTGGRLNAIGELRRVQQECVDAVGAVSV